MLAAFYVLNSRHVYQTPLSDNKGKPRRIGGISTRKKKTQKNIMNALKNTYALNILYHADADVLTNEEGTLSKVVETLKKVYNADMTAC